MRSRSRRLPKVPACLSAAALFALTGCVTVHGEREIIPSATKSEAAKALTAYTDAYNKANRALDPKLNAGVETGALAAIDQAGLKARGKNHPNGNPDHEQLKLTDARFVIPKQAGWPKFFMADTDSNRDDNRWMLVFTRDGIDQSWKAAYLTVLAPDQLPEFKKDKNGFAEPVPNGAASGLSTPPNKLSKSYADYLDVGKGTAGAQSSGFEPGPHTTELRAEREKQLKTPKYWTQYADQPARPPQYAPVALRTKDGGALAFFATHHTQQRSMARGYRIGRISDPNLNALLTGKPRRTLTLIKVSESVVKVPAKNADSDGVEFLSKLEGLTEARGG